MKKFFYLVTLVVISLSIFIACEPSIGKDGMGKHKEHKYVDLGLPSGLKWATCNVGATTPEEYGDYFAWGEVEPKEVYNWSTYKYGTEYNLIKYNGSDNKKTLDLEDDVAYVNWGGKWRMPTEDELLELFRECTWAWTTQNGVNGRKLVGPNGNSIFLPAAGYMYEGTLYGAGSVCYFWSGLKWFDPELIDDLSSNNNIDNPVYAFIWFFKSYTSGSGEAYRCNGLPVRPICH